MRPRWGLGAALAALLAAAYVFWPPDVSYLRTENPRTTAYIQRYIRRANARGKTPVVMMRWTPIEEFSPHLRHAVVIAEDDMFYRHHGVDWDALRWALRYDWRKGKWARGGSTITQQVARNLFLSPARTPWRKLQEMLIAWRLERTLGKGRILELYLNIAEWGVGIYGAQAASEIYFGKPASAVTPEEAVALASALPSPWRLNPAKEPRPWLVERRIVLLDRMRRAGFLPTDVPESEIEIQDALEISPSTSVISSITESPAEPSPDPSK